MNSPLKGKNIVLGITGGIAAYKSVVLLRLLVKAGADVQVIATPAALEFVRPVTLSVLSHRPVVSEFFTANTGEWHSHVDLGLWADAMVIAPATACTLAKMATGVADNMLVTSYLSTRAKVFAAPAMDFDMMIHPTTQRNLATLAADGITLIDAESGELASGLSGKGRMAEPEEIVAALENWFLQESGKGLLAGKCVLITAGPTRERIDPVRYIGNFSTGKMGYAIAREAARQGAHVVLVSGPTALKIDNPDIEVIHVESAREMLGAVENHISGCDVAIFSAAVADYAPRQCAEHKIKREKDTFSSIELERNPDIAATAGKSRKPGQFMVGFALETDNGLENAKAKLKSKNMDMIVLNSLADKGAGFGTDTNKVTLVGPSSTTELPLKSKNEVATDIIAAIAREIDTESTM